MTSYECKYCNYITTDSGNFTNHKKTKKHLKKIDTNSKDKEIENLKLKILEKEKEIVEKDKEIEKIILEKENEKLQAINKIYEEQKANTINNTQNNTINIGTLNYISNKYPDAPPLEKITNFIINGIDTNDASQHDKFIDDVFFHHKHKSLHTLLGDHIVSIYKKTDLNKQSFHTTDTARLNYAVRVIDNIDYYESDEDIKMIEYDNKIDKTKYTSDELELLEMEKEYKIKLKEIYKQKELKRMIDENQKLWVSDKNGYKICKLLIDPTIKQMVGILKKKSKQKLKSKKNKDTNITNDLEYHKKISEIIDNIDTKKLKNDINKYIAPVFNLSKKHI
jgi:hypothetical protein